MSYRNVYVKSRERFVNTPIKIGVIFNLFTLSLFFWGPYNYTVKNEILLVIFILFSNLMMYLGFAYGTQRRVRNSVGLPRFPIEKALNILFWISLFCCIPKFIIYTGMYNFGLTNIISEIYRGFSNILFNANELYSYRLHYSVNAPGIWRYINWVIIIFGPAYWAYMGLSMYYFKNLSLPKKAGTIFIWVLYITQYVYSGTNAGFFHFFVTLIAVLFAKFVLRTRNSTFTLSALKKRFKIIVAIIAIIILLSIIYSMIMGSRIGNVYLNGYNKDSFYSLITPEPLRPLLSYIVKYYGAPYARLEYAFDEPFTSTFGVGYSWFLLDNIPFFSKDLWNRTYPMKLNYDYGIDYYACWHTAYMWFANDVSFFGVPVVLFFLFILFGKCWKEFIETGNMLSFLVYLLCIRMLFFMSANNQIFQQPDTLFAFWILLLYRFCGRKWRWESYEDTETE